MIGESHQAVFVISVKNMCRLQLSDKFIGSEDGWNVVKILIASRVREEAKLVHLAERLNATICHQIDAVRSILSFEKESMRNSQ